MRYLLLLVFVCHFNSVLSQEVSLNSEGSSDYFIEQLNQSKEVLYTAILEKYDNYIADYPNEIIPRIERCKFIGNSFYDSYEDYNPNYDEMISCIDELYESYPSNPYVLLYKLDYTWGDERQTLLQQSIYTLNKNKSAWTYQQQSRLYEMASTFYSETDDQLSIQYGKQATRLSDSLDLSISMAESYLRLGQDNKAKEVLVEALYYDSEYAWTLQRKGELLINFNEIELATEMFERAKKKDSTVIDNGSFYQILANTGNYEKARSYLVNDTLNDWNKIESMQKLLNHDISYSSYDTAIITYRRMQELDSYDDLLAIKRLKLFLKSPLGFWNANDLKHLLYLKLSLIIIFLLPYLWILPVYSVGKLFSLKVKKRKLQVDWKLKHFWLISAAYLFSQFALILIFSYQDYVNMFLDIGYDYSNAIIDELNSEVADANIFYFILMSVFTLLFLNRKRLAFVINTNFSLGKIVIMAIGFVCFNAIVLKIVTNLFPIDDTLTILPFLNPSEEITTVVNEYGFLISFLFVVIIVPFYEEIIFRGVALASVEKYIGFASANVIQAVLFALIHMNLQLFLFYFSFGIITGLITKKSGGLMVGIIFHAVNNFLVLLSIVLTS